MKRALASVFGAVLALALGWRAMAGGTIENAAERFLDSLSPAERAKAVLAESPDQRPWAYTPGPRPGLALKELSEKQRGAATALLRETLSESGFKKAEAIRTELEAALREAERNPGRDTELYNVVFFGDPHKDKKWSWRWEGHHVSFTFHFAGGKLASAEPQFLGSNPAEVRDGPKRGLRVLAAEEDLAYELVRSLTKEQAEKGVLKSTVPADLFSSNHAKPDRFGPEGISWKDLDEKQRTILDKLIRVYAEIQRPAVSAPRLDRIKKSGFDKVVFAWIGSTEKGRPHYYRVHGPTFLIELDNTQNSANHVHSVWRDHPDNPGEDAIAEHYRSSPHHRQ